MPENDIQKDHQLGWLLVIPVIIVAALVLNGLDPTERQSKLYYLDATRAKLVAESRKLELMGSMEERSKQVLEELMLGPFSYKLQPLFKQDARLVAVMHRGNVLYVDLDIPDLAALDVSFGLIRSAFDRTLAASVPGFGVLELFVNGRSVKLY